MSVQAKQAQKIIVQAPGFKGKNYLTFFFLDMRIYIDLQKCGIQSDSFTIQSHFSLQPGPVPSN
jgi:hypothetical protein